MMLFNLVALSENSMSFVVDDSVRDLVVKSVKFENLRTLSSFSQQLLFKKPEEVFSSFSFR